MEDRSLLLLYINHCIEIREQEYKKKKKELYKELALAIVLIARMQLSVQDW